MSQQKDHQQHNELGDEQHARSYPSQLVRNIHSLQESTQRSLFAVGLMTGTSLDGVDVALVRLQGFGMEAQCDLIHFISLPLSYDLKVEIQQQCHNETSTVAGICALNVTLGHLYVESVQQLLNEVEQIAEYAPEQLLGFQGQLDFIASHGQTIYHIPPKIAAFENVTASTLQIGDPSSLAYHFKTDVYFNFRMMDIAAGGDGAPLVPMTELMLYRDLTKNRLLQNIGGIGNVTVMPKNAAIDDVYAFDTGPGNMMINDAMKVLYQRDYDESGLIASQGELIDDLWETLKAEPYIQIAPPKSTGREYFGKTYTERLLDQYADDKPEDVIHTLTRFAAFSIAESYRQFILPTLQVDEVIVGGGGAYNLALMKFLQDELQAEFPMIRVITNEAIGISSDAKEAIAFALLGYQTYQQLAGNVPRATGARESVVLGQICPNPFPVHFK